MRDRMVESLENYIQVIEVKLCRFLRKVGLPYITSDYLTKDSRPREGLIREFSRDTPGIAPALEMFEKLHRLRRQIASLPERSRAVDHAIVTALWVGAHYEQACSEIRWKDDADRGFNARCHDYQTLGLANHNRRLEAEALWTPLQEEFREMCEDGMKPDTARSKILNNWAEPKGAPSMKTARKWLRLDDEAD